MTNRARRSVGRSQRHALRLAEERRLTWIHPYNDEPIIAGQGTIALDL
jgi:threonine dehydratase